MGDLSIKVTIANRVYPLTIQREEEAKVRRAVDLVNENMRHLEENYAVRDRQDLLAMTALDYATRLAESEQMPEVSENGLSVLRDMDRKLNDYLKSI